VDGASGVLVEANLLMTLFPLQRQAFYEKYPNKCQQKCQQTSSVGSKMELRKVGWNLLELNHKRL
jgi:hypothetical protein